MKIVVIVFVLLILASLASALFFLVNDRGQSKRTVKALALRVGYAYQQATAWHQARPTLPI